MRLESIIILAFLSFIFPFYLNVHRNLQGLKGLTRGNQFEIRYSVGQLQENPLIFHLSLLSLPVVTLREGHFLSLLHPLIYLCLPFQPMIPALTLLLMLRPLIKRRGDLDIAMMIMSAIIFPRPLFAIIFFMGGALLPHAALQLLHGDLGKAEYFLHLGCVLEEFTQSNPIEQQGIIQTKTIIDYLLKKYRQTRMKSKKKSGMEEYEELLVELKEYGPYQTRLIVIMMLYWFLTGINEGIFQISLAWQEKEWEFYAEQTVQFVNVILFTYLSLYISRYYVNIILIGILTLACVFVIIGVFANVQQLKQTGIFIIVTFHYSLAFNILMINLEFHRIKSFPRIWLLSMIGMIVGKVTSISIASSLQNEAETAYKVILPGCVLYILTSLLYFESPRFLIDNNFEQAESLMKNITEMNKVKQENVTYILQRQFFWNKVNLQKYSVLTLFQFDSISSNTYVLTICSLLLGVICRCPDFIQHIQNRTSLKVEDSVQILWISVFQLCGLFFSYLACYVLKRRTMLVALSVILLLISCLLALLDQTNFSIGDAVLYSMSIFGLNAFFSVAYYFFLIISSIEFYPHTIRTLACGLIMAAQKLGKMLFSLHIQFIQRNAILLELVVCCSILLLMHSCIIEETLHLKGQYQIAEIQEKESEDY